MKSHCTTESLTYVTQGPHLDILVICVLFCCDHQDGKADVILRYNPDEARNLKAYGELPDNGTVHSIAVGKYFFYMIGVLLILFPSLSDKNVDVSQLLARFANMPNLAYFMSKFLR